MSSLTVTVEDAGRRLEALVVPAGEDLVVVIGGGDAPHVGAVVLAVPVVSRSRPGAHRASTSVLTVVPHRDEPLARVVAERLVERLGRTVVATAGVHEDGLEPAGVAAWLELGDRLASAVAARVMG